MPAAVDASPRLQRSVKIVIVLLAAPPSIALVLFVSHWLGDENALPRFIAAFVSAGVGGVLAVLLLPVTVLAARRQALRWELAVAATVANGPGLLIAVFYLFVVATFG